MSYTKEEAIARRRDMALLTQKGWTITKIAKEYGVTRQCVSQLLQKAAKEGQRVLLRRRGKFLNKDYDYLPFSKKTFTKNCVICKKEFDNKSAKVKTCSNECRGTLLHKVLLESKGKNGDWSRYKKISLVCKGCGKSFERTNYLNSITIKSSSSGSKKNNFCSKECYRQSTRAYKWPSLEEVSFNGN